jgi:hypothetical protein
LSVVTNPEAVAPPSMEATSPVGRGRLRPTYPAQIIAAVAVLATLAAGAILLASRPETVSATEVESAMAATLLLKTGRISQSITTRSTQSTPMIRVVESDGRRGRSWVERRGNVEQMTVTVDKISFQKSDFVSSWTTFETESGDATDTLHAALAEEFAPIRKIRKVEKVESEVVLGRRTVHYRVHAEIDTAGTADYRPQFDLWVDIERGTIARLDSVVRQGSAEDARISSDYTALGQTIDPIVAPAASQVHRLGDPSFDEILGIFFDLPSDDPDLKFAVDRMIVDYVNRDELYRTDMLEAARRDDAPQVLKDAVGSLL